MTLSVIQEQSLSCSGFTIWGDPVSKPRMTQRDKWMKRKCVVRYRAWADSARLQAGKIGADVIALSWVAYFPLSASRGAKKKASLAGQLHRLKPDRDNVDKAVLDALFESDCGIAMGSIEKRWDDGKGPRIEVTITHALSILK